MIIDLTQQFLSYAPSNQNVIQSTPWSASSFIKISQNLILQLRSLKGKIHELEQLVKSGRRFAHDKQSKMMLHIRENIKVSEQGIKKLSIMTPDIKCSNIKMLQVFKINVMATIEMKHLQLTIKIKEIYQKQAQKFSKANKNIDLLSDNHKPQIDLSKKHFIDQTQQELMQQVAKNQYKQIQKSIHDISQMYKEMSTIVKVHEEMIERISGDIDQTDQNVEGGRRNLAEAQRKQQGNRAIIIKLFTVLYVIVFVYLVLLD